MIIEELLLFLRTLNIEEFLLFLGTLITEELLLFLGALIIHLQSKGPNSCL